MAEIEVQTKRFVRNGYTKTLVDIAKAILILSDIMPILYSQYHFKKGSVYI